MAYAWSQVQSALKVITETANSRAGLIRAFGKLSDLRMKDLPAEARDAFAELTDCVRAGQWNRIVPAEVKIHVMALTDTEVDAAIARIIAMRDALAYYQPLPRLATGTRSQGAIDGQVAKPIPLSSRRYSGKEQRKPGNQKYHDALVQWTLDFDDHPQAV